jgi:hypothetical protein
MQTPASVAKRVSVSLRSACARVVASPPSARGSASAEGEAYGVEDATVST